MISTTILIAISLIASYLIGSIPNAVWIGKVFFNTDVRTKHSGNAGATNSVRTFGVVTGLIVLALDILKGVIPPYVGALIAPESWTPEQITLFQTSLALCCILGHVFPVFAKFKGGKGVATIVGIIIILFPKVLLPVAAVFVLVFLLFRYISLASIVAGLSFPFLVIFAFHEQSLPLILLAIAIGIFIPATHYKNILRLVKGTESKFKFKKID